LLGGCTLRAHDDPASSAPPSAIVDREDDGTTLRVDHPERFPIVAALARTAAPELHATGVVNPDVSRNVPVVSLASGRVVETRVRLGDAVQKGQLLLRIQSADAAAAAGDYHKAVADDELAHAQLERNQELFDRGAIAKKDLEVAQDAEKKAAVDRETASERLRVLGLAIDHPKTSGTIDIIAPVSGIITEQNVTNAAGVKSLDNSPNLFTISDLSHVWIVCDVYEDDLPSIRAGDAADVHLAAYPDRVLNGRVSNIAPVLDATIRTAKVRIEVANPGLLKVGMFVTATFRGQTTETRAVVPASAILHLHDREWVYVPIGDRQFARQPVVGGAMLPGQMQELTSGLRPGDRVVSNALVLQNTVEQ
jgi:cobalt-zinc-cadmium efflux system membrane fusion protein